MSNRRKGKRRNSEKRKEKSRDAARSRRSKEAEVFYDLASLLPMQPSQTAQQDKASIIRLAISHLKLRQLLGQDMSSNYPKNSLMHKLDMQYPKTLEGFMVVIAQEGDMMYISDNVCKFLGLTQIELIGHSVYDFTHPCDHDEIRDMLHEKPGQTTDKDNGNRTILMRMKCTLTSKGRNINLKSATYKVMRCSGRYVTATSCSNQFLGMLGDKNMSCMLLLAEPIQHPSNIEVPLDSRTFVSRHSMDMRLTYCDERIGDLLGYSCQDLVGQSIFNYHHALDTAVVKDACKDLMHKGQALITSYRFLACGGGYCWVQTEATMITNQRTDKPQCVVCVNYVLSGVEEKGLILSDVQLGIPSTPIAVPITEKATIPMLPSGIVFSTESIFAPRPKDADRDILTVTRLDGTEHTLGELTDLAPSAGNVMMPLSYYDHDQQFEMMPLTPPHPTRAELTPTGGLIHTKPEDENFSGTTDMSVLDLSFLRHGGTNNKHQIETQSGKDSCEKPDNKYDTAVMSPEIDFDVRAPYIPMEEEADQMFDSNWVPQFDPDFENSKMLGITETVFAPKPPELAEEERHKKKYNETLNILRLQSSGQMPRGDCGEISRNAGPPKMKRPMETNRLETGPPAFKMSRVEHMGRDPSHVMLSEASQHKLTPLPTATVTHSPAPTPPPQLLAMPDVASFFRDAEPGDKGSSVLRNLLLRGEDVNYGYRIDESRRLDPNQLAYKNGSTLRSMLSTSSDEEDDLEIEDSSSDDDIIMLSREPSPHKPQITTPYYSPGVVPLRRESPPGPMATGMVSYGNTTKLVSHGPTTSRQVSPGITTTGRPDLVIIRSNNQLMFAPITNKSGGGTVRVMDMMGQN